MGKRGKVQRKNAAMLDSEDDSSSVSSASTMQSDCTAAPVTDDVEIYRGSPLDEALEALYEKRGSTREKALGFIIEAFSSNLQHEFVENKRVTLLHQCLNSIKKGSSKEIALASRVIGLLALTVGTGNDAREILDESVAPISQALKSGSESSRIASLLGCLAVVTFVGGNPPDAERSMEIMWQVIHPKLRSNVVAVKPSAAVITAVVSSWSFLLSTIEGWRLDPKYWQETISYLSGLLANDDRSVRIAAGEALALIFEIGSIEKFTSEVKEIQGLKVKILNQVRDLSMEAGGKGAAKKDLKSQRDLFKDILEYFEGGYCPEASVKIGGDMLYTSTWFQLIQLNFLKHFLGGGFIKHMQENEFIQDVFGFTPTRKNHLGIDHLSSTEKKMYRSPNSASNKARTKMLNKQRMLSESKNVGHFAVSLGDEDQ